MSCCNNRPPIGILFNKVLGIETKYFAKNTIFNCLFQRIFIHNLCHMPPPPSQVVVDLRQSTLLEWTASRSTTCWFELKRLFFYEVVVLFNQRLRNIGKFITSFLIEITFVVVTDKV